MTSHPIRTSVKVLIGVIAACILVLVLPGFNPAGADTLASEQAVEHNDNIGDDCPETVKWFKKSPKGWSKTYTVKGKVTFTIRTWDKYKPDAETPREVTTQENEIVGILISNAAQTKGGLVDQTDDLPDLVAFAERSKVFKPIEVEPGQVISVVHASLLGFVESENSLCVSITEKFEPTPVPTTTVPVPTTPAMTISKPACDMLTFKIKVQGNLGNSPQEFSIWDGRQPLFVGKVNPNEEWSSIPPLPIKVNEVVRVVLHFRNTDIVQLVHGPSDAVCNPVVTTPPAPQTPDTQTIPPQVQHREPVLAFTGINIFVKLVAGLSLVIAGVVWQIVKTRRNVASIPMD